MVEEYQPDEIYNLAAQSFVQTSWSQPVLTGEFTALGVTRILEAVKKAAPKARFYQASSSEMFGKVVESPQKESTPFYPRSPYGVAKVYGHWITVNYRESFGLYAVSRDPVQPREPAPRPRVRDAQGHRRRRRASNSAWPPNSASATSIRAATGATPATTSTRCGACCSSDTPDDYVIGTGHTWSVRQLCEAAFKCVGLDYRDYVVQDPRFLRPAEVDLLVADPTKAEVEMGWAPTVGFEELVEMMVRADMPTATPPLGRK